MDFLQGYSDLWDSNPPEILCKTQMSAKNKTHAISFAQIECSTITEQPPVIILNIETSTQLKEMRQWCRDNLKDKFVLVPYSGLWCCFWNRRDAMHFRLVWDK